MTAISEAPAVVDAPRRDAGAADRWAALRDAAAVAAAAAAHHAALAGLARPREPEPEALSAVARTDTPGRRRRGRMVVHGAGLTLALASVVGAVLFRRAEHTPRPPSPPSGGSSSTAPDPRTTVLGTQAGRQLRLSGAHPTVFTCEAAYLGSARSSPDLPTGIDSSYLQACLAS
jgi:hypothetical protein